MTGGILKIKANSHREDVNGDEKNFIKVDIIDNGIGMSEDVQKKMFVPFFTTKEVGKGTGLGMKIVYDIIKNIHKGDIRVKSTKGEGTIISVLLEVNS